MPLRLPEPGSFERKLKAVQLPAASLLRLSKYPDTEPWWSRGLYRFDGPHADEPGSFGTCYASERLDVAFAESVIHDDAWFRNGRLELPRSALHSRRLVWLQRPARPELVLADLSGKALKALGLNNDISAGSDYTLPIAWARAIHDASPAWDGIRYVSRQHNEGFAVALFERSRVTVARVRKLNPRQLDRLCDEFQIAAVADAG